MPPQTALTATPTRMMRAISRFPRALAATTAVAAIPPAKAATAMVQFEVRIAASPALLNPRAPAALAVLSTVASDAPTAAPEETPINPGSASGLANTACSAKPEIASPAPTMAARDTRGRRTSHSTTSRDVDCPRLVTMCARERRDCPALAPNCPTATDHRMAATSPTARAVMTAGVLAARRRFHRFLMTRRGSRWKTRPVWWPPLLAVERGAFDCFLSTLVAIKRVRHRVDHAGGVRSEGE